MFKTTVAALALAIAASISAHAIDMPSAAQTGELARWQAEQRKQQEEAAQKKQQEEAKKRQADAERAAAAEAARKAAEANKKK